MFCSGCGKEISDDALFCPNCGKEMTEETEVGGGNVDKKLDNGARPRPEIQEPYYKKPVEEKSMVLPVILGVVIVFLVVGIGVAVVLLYRSNKADESIYVAPTVVPSQAAENTTEAGKEDVQEQDEVTVEPKEVNPKEVTASLVSLSSADLKQYLKATCSSTSQSSMIIQEGLDNSAKVVLDGRDDTSWQEDVDGDGLGEKLSFGFSKEYSVRYITFKLGNWRDNQYFASNNRPKTLVITLGDDFKTTVTFPDYKEEFCLELSDEVKAKNMTVTIQAVYKGTEWDDTCINEITVYGK